MATDGAVQGGKNSEEFINKNGQQEHKTIEESSGEQKMAVLEQTKQEEIDGKKLKSKRATFSLLRSERNSKSELPSGEYKPIDDMSDESEKVARKDGETGEQLHAKDEVKIEFGASSVEGQDETLSVDMKNKETDKSTGETQEKSPSKGSKGKKLKHLPSFGRNKKEVDITTEYVGVEIPDNKTQEVKEDSPVSSERSGSTRDEVCQSSENASNEPVLVHTSDFNATVEVETESSLNRNKNLAKIRKLSRSEDEQKTTIDQSEKISASKENDDADLFHFLLDQALFAMC